MRIPNDNPAEFLTRLVPFIEADGARNLNAICRELSIPYQTLRFRMGRLKEQGISVLPLTEISKLGLERVWVSFEFSRDVENPKAILGGMHQKAGLKYYSRVLFTQEMNCEFLIPKGSISELRKLLRALEEMKIIENFECKPVMWKEVIMMKTKYFDYTSGEWDVDFSRLVGDPSGGSPKHSGENVKLDYNDLLIIKSLQMEPWIKVVDLARKVNLSVGDVSYHLNRHVIKQKLIPSFRLRWVGTKEAWAKHTIVIQSFMFDKLSDESARHAMSVMTAAPFTFDHYRAEDGTYFTELMIPVSHFPETQTYISDQLRRLGLKPRERSMDWSLTSTFTIPYTLFERRVGWKFEAETALGYVLQMISQYPKA
jgi:hypothetical protein